MENFERSIPFIRLGLISLEALALSLTIVPIRDSIHTQVEWSIEYGIVILSDIVLGLVAFLPTLRKTYSGTIKGPARAVTSAADAVLAIILMVVHVDNVIVAQEYWRVSNTVMVVYGGVFALIASLIHFGLAATQAHVFLKGYYGGSATCTDCGQTSNRSMDAPARTRSSSNTHTHANEAGASEGDRLITTADD